MSATHSLTDIPALASGLRHNKLTCEQAVTASIEAIGDAAQSKHVFRHVAGAQAIEEAHRQDIAEATRHAVKPLAGLPVAVTELVAVDGQPTTAATRMQIEDLAPPQGYFIKKLQDLGAVIVGKTASSEFRLAYRNLSNDLPANPHYPDEDYVAGGASSGSAVSVAKGLSSFSVSVDGGGSTRVAASLCGIVGFKPPSEFWPRDGMFPLSRELDGIGLLTRKVSDLAFVMQALGAGVAPNMSGAPLRLGVAKKFFYEDLHPAVVQAITSVFERLAKSGALLTPIVLPDFASLEAFIPVANSAGLVRFLGRDRVEQHLDETDATTKPMLRLGLDADIGEVQKLFEARRAMVNRINANLAHIDAFITPTLPNVAVPVASLPDVASIQEWQTHTVRNVRFANLFNMAAITIPIPGPQPIGLQLMATAGNELKLIGIAQALQRTLAE